MNNFHRFIALIGLTLTLLVGNFTSPVFAQQAPTQQAAPAVLPPVGMTVYNLKIGNKLPDAPLFEVHLTLDSSDLSVKGSGEITQSVYPPLDIKTNLEGSYKVLPFLVRDTRVISFNLTGYPPTNFPKNGGIGPEILPNVKLKGTFPGEATYEYRTNDEQPWQTVKDVPVTVEPISF